MPIKKRIDWPFLLLGTAVVILVVILFVAISGCGNALASRSLPKEEPKCDRCCCMMAKIKDCHHSCKLIPPDRAPTDGENHMCGDLCHLKLHGCDAEGSH